MNKDLKFIADHFGHFRQLAKASEEHDEAKVAIENYRRALKIENDPIELAYYRECVIEELADAYITGMQVIYHEMAEDEFAEMVQKKINRTIQRIKDGYYDAASIQNS